jgi:hypothetical protein
MGISRQGPNRKIRLPWVNHVNTVFESNADDIILCEISGNWRKALADLIRFISLMGASAKSSDTDKYMKRVKPFDDVQTSYLQENKWQQYALPTHGQF